MTPNDWLYQIKQDLIEVIEENNQTFIKGVETRMEGVRVSVTVADQGDYYEAYISCEGNAGTEERKSRIVSTIVYSLCAGVQSPKSNEDSVCVKVSPAKIRDL